MKNLPETSDILLIHKVHKEEVLSAWVMKDLLAGTKQMVRGHKVQVFKEEILPICLIQDLLSGTIILDIEDFKILFFEV
ncbi:unnamed protein product [Calypogeia fissa]